jgi:acyl-CoA thioesterase-1
MGEQRRAPWWAVVLSGLTGALVAVLVMTVGQSGSVVTHPAAATRAAAQTTPRVPTVTFIGDSWTEGYGATALRGYVDRTAEDLGWNYYNLGVGSSGYTQLGRGSTFADRVDRAVATHPDVIVVQGSLNDNRSTPAVVAADADETLARLRAEAGPHTRILVMGASYVPGMTNATIDWINQSIQHAASASGLEFVNPAAEDWNDPGNPSIWSDRLHPNDRGYQMLAEHLEPLLLRLAAG